MKVFWLAQAEKWTFAGTRKEEVVHNNVEVFFQVYGVLAES